MRPFIAAILSAGTVAFTAGRCNYTPPPVPVGGDSASIAQLTGRWIGEYRGIESGRTGSIVFELKSSGDSATGDVLMDARQGGAHIQPADSPEQHRLHATTPQMLFIRFVGVKDGKVAGQLEPYVAPDCDCVVYTVFTGFVRADTIDGTFFTEARTLLSQRGEWRVVRRR